MKDKIVTYVYETDDYGKFKTLAGNRAVLKTRADKIKKSIEDNGWIMSPIIVNDKFEVIDGQGRLKALAILGMPVQYIMQDGIGRQECIALNAYSTNWSMLDYVASYADAGKEDYIRLLDLMEMFPKLGLRVCYQIANGTADMDSGAIKSGRMIISKEKYDTAIPIMEYVDKFLDYMKDLKGRKVSMIAAIAFAFQCDDVDKDRLLEKYKENRNDISAPANIDMAFKELTRIYNKKLSPKKHIFLSETYQKCMSGKYGWYKAKWGTRAE